VERFRIHSGDRIALAVKERNVVIERLKRIEDIVFPIKISISEGARGGCGSGFFAAGSPRARK